MSHYRVAVFANDPSEFENLLAPYSETDEQYFEYIPANKPDDYLQERYAALKEKGLLKDTNFNKWLEDLGYIVKDGMICYYGNPNAKWDWYSLDGGEWEFDLKRGEEYDDTGFGRKNQYSYHNSERTAKECREHWVAQLQKAAIGENRDEVKAAEAFLKTYPDPDKYVERIMTIHPYAFITPDGVWHAPGTVGWFGMSDDTDESYATYMKEWIDYINSDENPYVTFADCHI